MIHEVDEGLRLLLGESGFEASGVEVVFDAPTREWAARRSAPTLCVFLYDIREDVSRRGSGEGEVHDADGNVAGADSFRVARLIACQGDWVQVEGTFIDTHLTGWAAGTCSNQVTTCS